MRRVAESGLCSEKKALKKQVSITLPLQQPLPFKPLLINGLKRQDFRALITKVTLFRKN
jgi:hypothetical protein